VPQYEWFITREFKRTFDARPEGKRGIGGPKLSWRGIMWSKVLDFRERGIGRF
jgi:hypothetical protein